MGWLGSGTASAQADRVGPANHLRANVAANSKRVAASAATPAGASQKARLTAFMHSSRPKPIDPASDSGASVFSATQFARASQHVVTHDAGAVGGAGTAFSPPSCCEQGCQIQSSQSQVQLSDRFCPPAGAQGQQTHYL